MQKQINALMQKQMSRKEFISTMGLGLASLIGLSAFLRLFDAYHPHKQVGAGYGSSAYGGSPKH